MLEVEKKKTSQPGEKCFDTVSDMPVNGDVESKGECF